MLVTHTCARLVATLHLAHPRSLCVTTTHTGGECDARSCYTALAVASSLRLDVPALLQRSGCVDYLRRCQVRLQPRLLHPVVVP